MLIWICDYLFVNNPLVCFYSNLVSFQLTILCSEWFVADHAYFFLYSHFRISKSENMGWFWLISFALECGWCSIHPHFFNINLKRHIIWLILSITQQLNFRWSTTEDIIPSLLYSLNHHKRSDQFSNYLIFVALLLTICYM